MTPGLILVVDDDHINRELLSILLKRDRHTVTTVDNGRQAMAMLMARKFDLVLLDIMMPEMDGYQVLERLQTDADLRHIPVIVISAMGETESVARAIQLGADDYLTKPFDATLLQARINASLEKKRLHDQEKAILHRLETHKKRAEDLLQVVIPLGVAISAERDFNRLLESILLNAQRVCHADGGTLYLLIDDELKFEIMRTDSLNVALGGTTGKAIPFKPLRLHDEAGQPNHHNVATHVALTGETINIHDAYYAAGFDFSGTRAFDVANGYRSKSFLTIPLRNHAQTVVGILQLLNAKDPDTGQVIAFDEGLQQMVETFSLLATTALEAYLREEELKNEIQHLQIVIDEVKRAAQVAEITETDYFQKLREKAQELRKTRE